MREEEGEGEGEGEGEVGRGAPRRMSVCVYYGMFCFLS